MANKRTYVRYVPGEGFANLAALRTHFRLGEALRIWVAGSVQVDTHDTLGTLAEPLGTLGVEWTL